MIPIELNGIRRISERWAGKLPGEWSGATLHWPARRACRGVLTWCEERANMGSVNPRIPKRLILEISRGLDLRHFIETGTHVGTSALWASRHFEKVWTVELHPQLFAQARDLLAGRPNVEQSLGDSAEMLRSLLPRLDRPAL